MIARLSGRAAASRPIAAAVRPGIGRRGAHGLGGGHDGRLADVPSDAADQGQTIAQRQQHLFDSRVPRAPSLKAAIASPFGLRLAVEVGLALHQVLSTQITPPGASSPLPSTASR